MQVVPSIRINLIKHSNQSSPCPSPTTIHHWAVARSNVTRTKSLWCLADNNHGLSRTPQNKNDLVLYYSVQLSGHCLIPPWACWCHATGFHKRCVRIVWHKFIEYGYNEHANHGESQEHRRLPRRGMGIVKSTRYTFLENHQNDQRQYNR